jgi:hypothetical protein
MALKDLLRVPGASTANREMRRSRLTEWQDGQAGDSLERKIASKR